MKKGLVLIVSACFLFFLILSGGGNNGAIAEEKLPPIPPEGLRIPGLLPEPDMITTYGPEGDVATWYDKLVLTPEEVEKVRSMNLKAAFELVTEIDWSRANLRGFQDACKMLNIALVLKFPENGLVNFDSVKPPTCMVPQ